MRRNHFAAVLAGLAAVALVAADASAMYHPTLGRFLQRDPVGHIASLSPNAVATATPRSSEEPRRQTSYWGWWDKQHCICVDEPEQCYIALEWRVGEERTPHPVTGNDVVARGMEGITWRLSAPIPVLPSQVQYAIQAHVTLTLQHRQKKSLAGCHLDQDVTQMDHNSKVPTYTISDYNPERHRNGSPDDWSPKKQGFQNGGGRTIYTPTTIVDGPGVGGTMGRVNDRRGVWFQANTFVVESPSVRKEWGYAATVASDADGKFKFGSAAWEDEHRTPRDPFEEAPLGGPGDHGNPGVPVSSDIGIPPAGPYYFDPNLTNGMYVP